jgi:hypothetical protein
MFSAAVLSPISDGGRNENKTKARRCHSKEPFVQAMGVDKEIPGYKMRARNIVFVGHDTRPDIRYLRHLGVPSSIRQRKHPCQTTHPLELITPCSMPRPTFLEALDTGTLFRILKRENNSRALGYLLYDLGIPAWHLMRGTL